MRVNGIILLNPYELECVKKAIVYLEKHYQDNISADQLALEVNIDIKKLQAGFKRLKGLTVHNYQIRFRLDRGRDDLSNFALSIRFIAARHGFSSSSHFGDLFKKDMGFPPKEYRRQLLIADARSTND